MRQPGIFTISLDFELHWGVSHRYSTTEYYENLFGTRNAIDKILTLFSLNDIHATWAVVGFLFCENKSELINYSPSKKPQYINDIFNNYKYFNLIGENEEEDPFHYAFRCINSISNVQFQEIGSHTFSHIYCLEKNIDSCDFINDITSFNKIAIDKGFIIKSIVFPRNQYDDNILKICKKYNLIARTQLDTYFSKPSTFKEDSIFKRFLRYADSYFPFMKKRIIDLELQKNVNNDNLIVPSSRFLRPYNNKIFLLNYLQLNRIKAEMLHSAKNSALYHLWWHPHNFGKNTDNNIAILKEIISYYRKLNNEYGYRSLNMSEIISNV